LAIELQHLLTIDDDFDVTITGFEIPEIDLILGEAPDKPCPDDVFDVSATDQSLTQPGDLCPSLRRPCNDPSWESTAWFMT
jgi:hypothetical protein